MGGLFGGGGQSESRTLPKKEFDTGRFDAAKKPVPNQPRKKTLGDNKFEASGQDRPVREHQGSDSYG